MFVRQATRFRRCCYQHLSLPRLVKGIVGACLQGVFEVRQEMTPVRMTVAPKCRLQDIITSQHVAQDGLKAVQGIDVARNNGGIGPIFGPSVSDDVERISVGFFIARRGLGIGTEQGRYPYRHRQPIVRLVPAA